MKYSRETLEKMNTNELIYILLHENVEIPALNRLQEDRKQIVLINTMFSKDLIHGNF